MNSDRGAFPRLAFWRTWGPLIACAILTGIALGLLIVSGASLARILLLAAVFTCPLAMAILWCTHVAELEAQREAPYNDTTSITSKRRQ